MPTLTARPPGPKGSWLSGNIPELRTGRLQFFENVARNYGDFVSLRFGMRRVILVNSPEAIEQILIRDNRLFRKHFALRLSPTLLGSGLLTNDGESWLRQRRLMQPAFQTQRLNEYAPIFVDYTQHLVTEWRAGEVRDFGQEMMSLMLRIATRVLFSGNVHGHEGDVSAALAISQKHFLRRFNSVLKIPLAIPTASNRAYNRAVRNLDGLVYDLIRTRRESGTDHGDLLSLLLHARDEQDQTGMTDRQLRDEVMTLFLAGHETTALLVSWAWYALSQQPELVRRLQESVDQTLNGRPCTPEDLPQLPLLEWVLLETLRLYPAAYLIGREALEPLEVGGYPIPRGMTLFMSQWVMHRDPRYWEDPLQFRPDRWDQQLIKRLPRIVYFPFGAGPRTCIGNSFAMLEASLVLVTLLQRFDFTAVPGLNVQPQASFTLRPDKPLRMVVSPRKVTE